MVSHPEETHERISGRGERCRRVRSRTRPTVGPIMSVIMNRE